MYDAHDLGGALNFGAVDRGRETQFAFEWEEKVFALTLACGMLGRWNLDQSRHARERMPAADYLASSYYEHWLHGLELLLLERGLVSEKELRSGLCDGDGDGDGTLTAVTANQVADILVKGAPTALPADAEPLFTVGDRVRVKQNRAAGHTRAPRYTRGNAGVVVRHHGAHTFPDRHADGDKTPRHLYGVRFDARELWGGGESAAVFADLFEPYLDAA